MGIAEEGANVASSRGRNAPLAAASRDSTERRLRGEVAATFTSQARF
jgi:hypothetical protein